MKLGFSHSACREASATCRDSRSLASFFTSWAMESVLLRDRL